MWRRVDGMQRYGNVWRMGEQSAGGTRAVRRRGERVTCRQHEGGAQLATIST
ncbi:hypothetical protein [Oryza sativa Japonica Group]|uniref:Uncharacterized protein n=2 Tax=Oryza sativa subsp. japonica TaxID=39947 RepID=Q5ZCS8_ORYSJ|nr:hypothetical protein [Oryza sativa Japonica Group]BAD53943.1 hypothetical protein [Oryza sativa Japonica Group]